MPDEGGYRKFTEDKPWFWRWGIAGWLLLGIMGAIAALWLAFSKAHQVLIPLIIAFIIAVLLEPLVTFFVRHHIPRWLGTVITMILIVVVIGGFLTVVIYGISSQAGAIGKQVEGGVRKINDWFEHAKVSDSFGDWVHNAIKKAWPQISSGLVKRLSQTVPGLASFAIGVFIGFFILIFILGDDGRIKEWVTGKMGVPRKQAEGILTEVESSLRGYFKGTTIIAAVNAIVVIPVVLILRVPLLWPIVLVTFITCYIPSFGGYIGGAFAVFITLASRGLTPALIMLAFSIFSHTILQNPVQAVAYGKTLNLHPLVALLVTLLGAVFMGITGAVLAVPLTAVVLKVKKELGRVREEDELLAELGQPPPGEESPGPPATETT